MNYRAFAGGPADQILRYGSHGASLAEIESIYHHRLDTMTLAPAPRYLICILEQ